MSLLKDRYDFSFKFLAVLSMSDILLRAMRTPSLKSYLTNRPFGLICLALSIMVSLSLKKDNRMIMSHGPSRL